MFSICILLFMIVNTSSMFDINMLVAIVVMFNIMELIMELLPNYSTINFSGTRQSPLYAKRTKKNSANVGTRQQQSNDACFGKTIDNFKMNAKRFRMTFVNNRGARLIPCHVSPTPEIRKMILPWRMLSAMSRALECFETLQSRNKLF